jgi:hypothetical protein
MNISLYPPHSQVPSAPLSAVLSRSRHYSVADSVAPGDCFEAGDPGRLAAAHSALLCACLDACGVHVGDARKVGVGARGGDAQGKEPVC